MASVKNKYRGTTMYVHVLAELVRAAQYRGQGRCYLFTITDLRIHYPDPGVHHDRSGCPRGADLRVHVRVIRAFSFVRHAHYRTSYGRIISWSSCSMMWQCHTKRPGVVLRKSATTRVTMPGGANTVSLKPVS
jgi:hypothetical protein